MSRPPLILTWFAITFNLDFLKPDLLQNILFPVKIMYPSTELMSLATHYSIITGKVGLFDTYCRS